MDNRGHGLKDIELLPLKPRVIFSISVVVPAGEIIAGWEHLPGGCGIHGPDFASPGASVLLYGLLLLLLFDAFHHFGQMLHVHLSGAS